MISIRSYLPNVIGLRTIANPTLFTAYYTQNVVQSLPNVCSICLDTSWAFAILITTATIIRIRPRICSFCIICNMVAIINLMHKRKITPNLNHHHVHLSIKEYMIDTKKQRYRLEYLIDLICSGSDINKIQNFYGGHQQHPIDADDGRLDTDKPPRTINKITISSPAAAAVLHRLHWEIIA